MEEVVGTTRLATRLYITSAIHQEGTMEYIGKPVLVDVRDVHDFVIDGNGRRSHAIDCPDCPSQRQRIRKAELWRCRATNRTKAQCIREAGHSKLHRYRE